MNQIPPPNSPPPPTATGAKILAFIPRKQMVEIGRISQDRTDPVARLEAELVLRTSKLKVENDDLKGRIEVLERCLAIITENLAQAKTLLGVKGETI